MQEDVDSVLHKKSNTILVQTFKLISAVVPEKSLTQISLCFSFE